MSMIDKLMVFQSLMSDDRYTYDSPEESVIRYALMKETWLTATPEAKQARRRQFLISGKKRRTVINLDYYEKMIFIYDLILEMLSKLEKIISEREETGKSVELHLLRIIGLLFVEKDFIDVDILPSHHVRSIYFQNLSNELHTEYPDLNLKQFAEKYTDMFETWPEKSKYEIKKS